MARRKKQDEDQSQENINNSDETFGLPEIEYQPLQREESPKTTASEYTSQTTSQETVTHTEMEREEVQSNDDNTNYYTNDDDGGSPWPKILGIAAILLVIAGGIWYFGVYRPKQVAEAEALKAKQEQEAEEKRLSDLRDAERAENERRAADSLALLATPATGVIDTLSERTGRYYVIIASAIDGDLIMDYAKTLAPKGLNPKIIPPYGKVKFYRLAIAEGDTYTATQATADQLKSEYSGGAWVVKY
jgi:hypothetical protein